MKDGVGGGIDNQLNLAECFKRSPNNGIKTKKKDNCHISTKLVLH